MRVIWALIGGVVIAGGLFVLMQKMIWVDDDQEVWREPAQRIDFIRVQRDERVRQRSRMIPDPPEEILPPPPPQHALTQQETAPTRMDFRVDIPSLGIPGGMAVGYSRYGMELSRDGDVMPLVRVEPQWPREALIQGIEGWVQVAFTIRADGSVANARVIDSHPRRMFDRSAVRAINHWRFAPRVVDGRAVEREAVQVIEFKLDNL